MATATLIPVSEYLKTMYHPDRDYVDGEVLERPLGETPHSGLQVYFSLLLRMNKGLWGLRPYTEQRLQITPTRFRIPDICAMRPGEAPGPILRTAPFLCIEIYSPEDTKKRMRARVDDYLSIGVEHVWLVDPVKRQAWTADAEGFHPVQGDALEIAGTPIRVELAELWAELDDIAAGR